MGTQNEPFETRMHSIQCALHIQHLASQFWDPLMHRLNSGNFTVGRLFPEFSLSMQFFYNLENVRTLYNNFISGFIFHRIPHSLFGFIFCIYFALQYCHENHLPVRIIGDLLLHLFQIQIDS